MAVVRHIGDNEVWSSVVRICFPLKTKMCWIAGLSGESPMVLRSHLSSSARKMVAGQTLSSVISLVTLTGTVAVAITSSATPAQAGTTRYFVGWGGNWEDAVNWWTNIVPISGDSAVLIDRKAYKNDGSISGLKVASTNSDLYVNGNTTITSSTLSFANDPQYNNIGNNIYLNTDNSSILTVSAGSTISGTFTNLGLAYGNGDATKIGIQNNGTITASVNAFTSNAYNITNNNIVQAVNGAELVMQSFPSLENGVSKNGIMRNTTTGAIKASTGGIIHLLNTNLINDGTVTINNATLVSDYSQLSGAGTFSFINGTLANASDSYVNLNGANLTYTTLNLQTSLNILSNQTLGGTGTIRANGSTASNLLVNGDAPTTTTLTIGKGTILTGRLGQIGGVGAKAAIVNNGSIIANTAGQFTRITNLTNNGIVQAINGNSLVLSSPWDKPMVNSATGTITFNGSAMNIQGTLINNGIVSLINGSTYGGGSTLSGTGTYNFTNSHVFMGESGPLNGSGTYNFTNSQLSAATSTGSGTYNFTNSQIWGGTFASTGVYNLNDSTLIGVTYLQNAKVTYKALKFNPANLRISGNLNLTSAGSITGLGTDPSVSSLIELDGNGTGSRLTIGAATTISGYFNSIGGAYQGDQKNVSTYNSGKISLNPTGQFIHLYNLTNNGIVEVAKGNTVLLDSSLDKIVNNNTISISGSELWLHNSFYNNLGATLTVNGNLQATSNIYNDGTISLINSTFDTSGVLLTGKGTYRMSNVAIKNILNMNSSAAIEYTGNMTSPQLATLSNAAKINVTGNYTSSGEVGFPSLTLNNAASLNVSGKYNATGGDTYINNSSKLNVGSALTLQGHAFIHVASGASLSFGSMVLDNSAVYYSGNQTIKNSIVGTSGWGTIYMDAPNTTLTIDPTATLSGYLGIGPLNPNSRLINKGKIVGNAASANMSVSNLINLGTVQATGSGNVTLNGYETAPTNAGLIQVDKGSTLTLSNGLSQTAGSLSVAGTVTALDGSTLVLSGGTLTGSGNVTAKVWNKNATINPGATFGKLTIGGDYTQARAGKLLMEIGGAVAGVSYDQLSVNGNVALDGTLQIAFLNNYTPVLGQTFNILSGTLLSGNFYSLQSLTSGYGFSYSQANNKGYITVNAIPAPAPPSGGSGSISSGIGGVVVPEAGTLPLVLAGGSLALIPIWAGAPQEYRPYLL